MTLFAAVGSSEAADEPDLTTITAQLMRIPSDMDARPEKQAPVIYLGAAAAIGAAVALTAGILGPHTAIALSIIGATLATATLIGLATILARRHIGRRRSREAAQAVERDQALRKMIREAVRAEMAAVHDRFNALQEMAVSRNAALIESVVLYGDERATSARLAGLSRTGTDGRPGPARGTSSIRLVPQSVGTD